MKKIVHHQGFAHWATVRALAIAVAILWLAGCATVPEITPTASPEVVMPPTPEPVDPTRPPTVPPTEPATPTSVPPAASTPADPATALLTNVARADLARRLNVAEATVVLVSAQETEMPVGSLGCDTAAGGENQGLTMGMEIALAAGEQEYVYRSDYRRLVPCYPEDFPGGHAPIFVTGAGMPRMTRTVKDAPPKSTPPPPQTADAGMRGRPAVASAIADLATRLKIAETQILVSQVEAVDWPDASLGCPRRGQMYAQMITPGYRIVLEAGGKTYEYHASETRAVWCGR